MNRRSALLRLLAAGAGFVYRSGDRALDATEVDAAEEDQNVLRSDVRLVLLDVAVRDHHGAFVAGLMKSNFSISEDGRPQKITVFDRSDRPVTVGILVDESLSMMPKRDVTLDAAETFVLQSNPNDELFVLSFNDRVRRGLPQGTTFSDNPDALRAALHRGKPEGKTALNDAVIDGLEYLKLGTRDRKALIVISDGGDNASKYNRAQLLDRVAASTATIYAIGVYDLEDVDRDPGILRRFAAVSGGEAYFPQTLHAIGPVCREIAAEIRSRYTMGYVPREGGHAVRHLQVSASTPDHGKLNVVTRNSYRYDLKQSDLK